MEEDVFRDIRPRKYSRIQDFWEKETFYYLLNFLFEGIRLSGGDGDGIWYSKYFWIDEIYKFILDHRSDNNLYLPSSWEVTLREKTETHEKHLYLGHGEEGLIITNSEQMFDNRPSWQEISIVW